MNIRQSVFGEIANRTGGVVSGVDVEALLRRFILFDSVVIKSDTLREVPFLIRAFGKSGFQQLLETGVLRISCEQIGVITGMKRDGVPTVPPSHFTFGMFEIANRDERLRGSLRSLQGIPGLKNRERELMEEAIMSRLERPPSDYKIQLQAQIESDVRSNTPALRVAIQKRLQQEFGEFVSAVEIRVEEANGRIFHLITNLPAAHGFSEQKTHELLESGISAVANLNQRIAEMNAYSSITRFTEDEAPVLFGKFAGIIGPQNPEPIEQQFGRVVTVADLPHFAPNTRVDVEKLLRARESPECLEFRSWLTTLDELSDREIAQMIGGVRNKLGFLIRSGTGKILRFAATSAIGMFPQGGLIAGPIAGALDSFLIDKVFKTSGVVAFLTKTYPSLYEHT
jgi:hypothetical protein